MKDPLKAGQLKARWMTEEEAQDRADEHSIRSSMVLGYYDPGTDEMVIRKTWFGMIPVSPLVKFNTILHELMHAIFWRLPPPLGRWLDDFIDGEWN